MDWMRKKYLCTSSLFRRRWLQQKTVLKYIPQEKIMGKGDTPVETDAQVVHRVAEQRARRALNQVTAYRRRHLGSLDHGLDESGADDAAVAPQRVLGLLGFDHGLRVRQKYQVSHNFETHEFVSVLTWIS